jgi:hypothetical protein
MSKIKSAIEIAMEKTEGMKLSADEKIKLQKQQIETEVRANISKYLDDAIDIEQLQKVLNDVDSERLDDYRRTLIIQLLDEINLKKNNVKAINALKVFIEERLRYKIDQIVSLISRYNSEIESARCEVEKECMERLKKMGISGSAVKPRIKDSSEWKRKHTEVERLYEDKLLHLKGEIKERLS